MEVNLSEETINTVLNSLRDSKQSLKKQLANEHISENRQAIVSKQLEEVEDALLTFEELVEYMNR